MVIRPPVRGRNWETLSEPYRRRLERNGISRRDYERGANLSRARGHSHTPESPEQAYKNPERFRDYLTERKKLVDKIERFKRDRWGDNETYNSKRAREAIEKHGIGVKDVPVKYRTLANLRVVAAMTDSFDDLDIDMGDDYADAFHYH